MPLQPISVPSNNNHFFSAFCLGFIYPSCGNDERYDDEARRLFGNITSRAVNNLRQELENHPSETLQSSLNSLINIKLRPKLVEYIRQNKHTFSERFNTDDDFDAYMKLILTPDTLCGLLEQEALAAMVGVSLIIHNKLFISVLTHNSCEVMQSILHLSFVNGTYYYFIDPDELRQRLFPLNASKPNEVNIHRHGTRHKQQASVPIKTRAEDAESRTNNLFETECKEKIDRLSQRYYEHLDNTRHLTNYHHKKAEILYEIRSMSTSRILTFLDEPCGIEGLHITNGELLALNRSNLRPWLFAVFLTTITFPLSIPILMIWSTITRGTPNFFKTTGEIYVENLLQICNQKPPVMSINTFEEGTYSPLHSSESSIDAQNTTQESHIELSRNFTTTDLDPKDLLTKIEVDAIEQIGAGIDSVTDHFIARIEDKMIRDDAGRPIITSYRNNGASDLLPKSFSMDIKCFFQWTSHRKERTTLHFSNTFKLPPDGQAFQPPIIQPDPEPELTTLQSISNLFWSPPPKTELNCQEALKIAEGINGMCRKRRKAYLMAFQLAKTDIQRVQVLESFINELSDYHDYLEKFSAYGRAPGVMLEINQYLTWLPKNYQTMCVNANRINTHFQAIFKLLQKQRIDNAWTLFEPYRPGANDAVLSFFIRRAFPHIQAMKHQLQAIFRISRHIIYHSVHGDSKFFIPEIEIIIESIEQLQYACKLIESYDPDQKAVIEEYAIAPLERLRKIGNAAADITSYEERQLRRDARIAYIQPFFARGIQPTYRIPDEDMDADEEEAIIDMTNFSL